MLNQMGQLPTRSAKLLENLAEFAVKQFKTEQELIDTVLNLIADTLQIRTPFLSSTLVGLFEILDVVNRNGCTLEAGTVLPLQDSYCSRICASGEPLVVEDSRNHPIFAGLQVTKNANIGSYIGVPIRFSSGRVVGTLCGIDPDQRKFTTEDIQFLQVLARSVAALLEKKIGVAARSASFSFELETLPTNGDEVTKDRPNTPETQPLVLIVDETNQSEPALAVSFSEKQYQVVESQQPLTLEWLEQAVAKHQPQLVVLVETEGADTEVEILAKFRQKPEYNKIPVLFLTQQRLSQIRAYISGATYCQLYSASLEPFFSKF